MRVSTHVYAEATHVMDLRRGRKRSLLKLREVQDLQEYTKAQDAQERKHEIEVQSRALAHFVCIHRGVCLFQRLLVYRKL